MTACEVFETCENLREALHYLYTRVLSTEAMRSASIRKYLQMTAFHDSDCATQESSLLLADTDRHNNEASRRTVGHTLHALHVAMSGTKGVSVMRRRMVGCMT